MSDKKREAPERSKRSDSKRVNYQEKNDSEFLNSSDVENFSQASSEGKNIKSNGTTATKYKSKNKPKMVPYEPVLIPFGEDEIDCLLSYREVNGEEEVLVKFKYRSYHHLKWLSRHQIEMDSTNGKSRFKKLKDQYIENPEAYEEPFNQLYLEIDRILDEGEIDDESAPDGVQVYLLVKWCGQPYEDSTWETLNFIENYNQEALNLFSSRQDVPGKDYIVAKERPKAIDFVKLEESPVFKNENTLRDYQLEGLNWLTYCWYHKQSSIMADEMGLGKTVQSVAFLYHIFRTCHMRGPFLVVAPLSTIPHWEREFNSWTDLNVIVFHGSPTSRNLIIDTEFYYKDTDNSRLSDLYRFDVLITTYEVAYSSTLQLNPIQWQVGIFDEAHRLKNRTSKVLEALKTYRMDHRVLLTGTPLQNSTKELFSLLNFLEPTRFDSEVAFLNSYGDLKSSSEVAELQALLKPLMLRRFKEDVEKSIPSKEETIIEVQLTNQQKTWYRAILERNFAWIHRGGKDTQGPSLNNIMMELRKCCNHPFLIKGTEEKIMSEYPDYDEQQYFETLVKASGKLVLLDKLLPKLKESGHKVLIFSQMTKVLDLLADYLVYRRYNFERIDGGVKGSDRQVSIDRFSTSPDSFAFLLCTRAGGVGINLTAADTVIIFDSDWNPQNDLQAQARVHRIGQKRPVKIYRLLCANTYERQMFDRANLKLGLDKAVMQKMDGSSNDNGSTSLSKKEVEDLLKLGAYGALLDDTESNKFYEEDIDAILQRRSTVVTYDSREKGSTFSKASFTTFEDNTTSIDDPKFWDKWAKSANVDPQFMVLKNPLIVDGARLRKQSKKYEVIEAKRPNHGINTPTNNPAQTNSNTLSPDMTETQAEVQPVAPQVEQSVDYERWTQGEVQLLIVRLMTFGLSNWDKVNRGFLAVRTLKDLVACTRCIISMSFAILQLKEPQEDYNMDREYILKAFRCPDPEVSEIFMRDLNRQFVVDVEVPYPDATPQQISNYRGFVRELPSYLGNTTRKPKALIHRLRDIYMINNGMLIADEEGNWRLFKVDVTIPSSLPNWWTPLADRDLVLGTLKHGFNSYTLFRKDPELIFSKICYDPASIAVRRRPLSATGDGEDDMEDMMEDESEENENNSTINKETQPTQSAEATEPTNTNAIEKEGEVVNESASVVNETSKLSSAGASANVDHEVSQLPSWPDGTMLRNRLKRFTNLFMRTGKPQKRGRRPNMVVPSTIPQQIHSIRQGTPIPSTVEYNATWTLSDHRTFIRTLNSYGFETAGSELSPRSWYRFQTVSGLFNKSSMMLDAYFINYVRLCYKYIEKDPATKSSSSVIHYFNFMHFLLTTKSEAQLQMERDEDYAEISRLAVPIETLTIQKIRKMFKCVTVLHNLRTQVVTTTDLNPNYFDIPKSINLPDWITNPVVIELGKAIALYGLDKMDLLVQDEGFPDFYLRSPSQFPNEHDLIKLMMYLRDQCTRIQTNQRFRPVATPTPTHSNLIESHLLPPPNKVAKVGRPPNQKNQEYLDQITSIITDSTTTTTNPNNSLPRTHLTKTRQSRLVIIDSPNGPILKLIEDSDEFTPENPSSKFSRESSKLKANLTEATSSTNGLQKITNFFSPDQHHTRTPNAISNYNSPDRNNGNGEVGCNATEVGPDQIVETHTNTNGIVREFIQVDNLPNLDYYLQEEEEEDYDEEE